MIKVRFTTKFKKLYKRADNSIQNNFNKRLEIFMINPNDQVLNNHKLIGKYCGYRSINVNGDWRVIYSIDMDGGVIFEILGTHSQLYG